MLSLIVTYHIYDAYENCVNIILLRLFGSMQKL